MELSKKRENYPDLAPILWHSPGTVAALLFLAEPMPGGSREEGAAGGPLRLWHTATLLRSGRV